MTGHMTYRVRIVVFACLALTLSACDQGQVDDDQDADVIIVGAGISGLSAALEMGERGVEVLVVDMNSVAGGHAVMAGGVAIVDSPLQQSLGIEDSADLAYRDWMEWTGDGDAEWTREYADNSSSRVATSKSSRSSNSIPASRDNCAVSRSGIPLSFTSADEMIAQRK
jgi:glycine/D-amino acid oxidase-like deaminating enzyme